MWKITFTELPFGGAGRWLLVCRQWFKWKDHDVAVSLAWVSLLLEGEAPWAGSHHSVHSGSHSPPFFFFFVFSRAALVAFGGSQAWGWIGATAASLSHSHSNTRSQLRMWPTLSQILNPLSEARDQTPNLMVLSRICFCCATTGTRSPPFSVRPLFFHLLLMRSLNLEYL